MATSNDLLVKQRSVIEFLAADVCSAANIQARQFVVKFAFQNVKPNRWSIGTKPLQVQGSSKLLPLQEMIAVFWDMEGVNT
ncbi:hypothetical protein ElyMa_005323800 [Elysia marginata]|uniref:DUF2384 domain-containing protein n=1 Tax=Elysia marginata TaxID=1093978 RepID=A0AAV4K1Y6_9GAST|nr:hypothetical protein ElyMa_005323800 [Elysia marginata]